MIVRRPVDVVDAMAVVMQLFATVVVVTGGVVTVVVEIATGKPHQRG